MSGPACRSCGGGFIDGEEVYASDWTVIEAEGTRMETRFQHIGCPVDVAAGVRELIEEHRGNRTAAYAGTHNYVPIARLEALLEAAEMDDAR
jgi:hypothetical protein